MEALETLRDRMLAGAVRYAQADRSDPFAYSRAMSAINNGIAGLRSEQCSMFGRNKGPGPGNAYFNADTHLERRKLPGDVTFADGSNTFLVTTYRNQVRP